MSEGVGRIRKGLFPQLDSDLGMESDVSEKMLLSSRNPRFKDDAARLERNRFIVQVVGDKIEQLWREGARGGGLHPRSIGALSLGNGGLRRCCKSPSSSLKPSNPKRIHPAPTKYGALNP